MEETKKKQTQNSKKKKKSELEDINLELLEKCQNSDFFFYLTILTFFSELWESPNCGIKSLNYPTWETLYTLELA